MNNMNSLAISPAAALRLVLVILFSSLLVACASTGTSSSKTRKVDKGLLERASIHTQLARGYMQEKQYAVAKTELETALKILPAHSDSNYVMALLQLRLEQYEDAKKYFANAVKYDKENSPAAHDFGTFLCQLGERERAVEYFDIAVSNPLFGQSKISYARAGQCLAPLNPRRAEGYLRKALELDSKMRPALFSLAQIKYTSGNHLTARAYIERFLAITKPQPSALYLAYKIESELSSKEQAELYRSQILLNFPGSKEANQLRKASKS